MLDEPTNHLDLPTIEWLETFLSTYPGVVILVTHDHEVAARARRRIRIRDGLIESDDGAHSVADQSVAP